jgi:hypothetical protein
MPVSSQGHYGDPSFPVVDWFCLFVDLWVFGRLLMSNSRLLNPYLYTFSIFTLWKSIVYYRICRDRIFFDKILVSEYKLFKRLHKANLFIALVLIYPPELEVKETTDTASSASFLDLYLEFDDSGQLITKIYDKRDDFNFKIINLNIFDFFIFIHFHYMKMHRL